MSLVTNQFNQMSTQEVSYSEFLDMVNGTGKWEGRSVKSVEIGSYQIDITLNSDEKTPYEVTYYCGRVADDELIPLLKEKGVDISGVIPDNTSTWIYSILSYLIPLVLIWVVLGVVMRRMGGGAMGVGKSNAKVYVEKQTGVTFKDVAGQDEAKESLQGGCRFPAQPEKSTATSVRSCRRVRFLWDLREPVRRSLPRQWRARRRYRFSRWQVRILWRCSSVSELPV